MATLTIPTTEDPFQSQKVTLDGVPFVLSLAYNQREDRWYLSLADDEGNPLLSGLKLQANWPILFRYSYLTTIPAGELMAIDTTTDGSPPTLLELGEGKRCVLTYFEAATKAALAAGATPGTA
jgi:hypothetical protein